MVHGAKGIGLGGLLALAGVIAGLAPASALAGSAASLAPTLVVGENVLDEKNDLVLNEASGKFVVGEVFFPMGNSAGSNCTVNGGGDSECDIFQIDQVFVAVHGNNDTVQQSIDLPSSLSGGNGNDQLFGGPEEDVINGDRGNDVLDGGNGSDVLTDGTQFLGADGNDLLSGAGGDDLLDGGNIGLSGAGGDAINGGAANDTLTYLERTAPVTITEADGVANDGEAGESDNVIDAENFLLAASADQVTVAGPANLVNSGDGADTLVGGNGADQLFAAAGADSLDGGTGPDLLSGGTGIDTALFRTRQQPVIVTVGDGANDGEPGEGDDVLDDVESVVGGTGGDSLGGGDGGETLDGGPGPDSVSGVGGDDRVLGGEGSDTASGGSGDDTIDPGEGTDAVSGGSGDDSIEARDGSVDTIECGSGSDSVAADPIDNVAADCDVPAPNVALIAPETSLDKSKVKRRKATFEFSGTDGNGLAADGLAFECNLDGKGFKPCASPASYKKLKSGRHTFEVRAKSAAGESDPTPAQKSFKVKRKRR